MPVSRSASRDAKAAPRSRKLWPVVLIGLAALIAVSLAALPASVITHFLPPSVHAEDFSGNIWHGSAGKISVNARDAGALEWRLHPAALLGLTVLTDLHWVKTSFVIDASAALDTHGFTAHAVRGGGPIEDLQDLGVAAGWHGIADVDFSELKGDFTKPLGATGALRVSNLSSAQIAGGADLGGYDLRMAPSDADSDGSVTAQLVDTGGPLEVQTLIHYSPRERIGTLSGTLKERADAPAALRGQLENLSQLRGRDSQGRIPVDLEFRL
ncbi:MAG: type II secretion system protein N [Steroidobacteraceae bacterium]